MLKKAYRFTAIISLFLAICLLVSCSGKKLSEDDKENIKDENTPLFNSYTDYTETKARLFGEFSKKIYATKELALPAGSALLNVSASDVAFLPLALLQDTEKAGGAFSGNAKGCYNCEAYVSSGEFNLAYTTYGGAPELVKGIYDSESGRLSSTKYIASAKKYGFEYMPTETGYIAQYITYGSENDIVRIVFEDGRAGICMFTSEDIPDFNFDGIEAFLQSDTVTVIEENGELKSVIDGKEV